MVHPSSLIRDGIPRLGMQNRVHTFHEETVYRSSGKNIVFIASGGWNYHLSLGIYICSSASVEFDTQYLPTSTYEVTRWSTYFSSGSTTQQPSNWLSINSMVLCRVRCDSNWTSATDHVIHQLQDTTTLVSFVYAVQQFNRMCFSQMGHPNANLPVCILIAVCGHDSAKFKQHQNHNQVAVVTSYWWIAHRGFQRERLFKQVQLGLFLQNLPSYHLHA